MRRKLTAAFLGAVLVLTGCAAGSPKSNVPAPTAVPAPSGDLTEVQYRLRDGRTVTCVVWLRSAVNGGGLSCDWANAK